MSLRVMGVGYLLLELKHLFDILKLAHEGEGLYQSKSPRNQIKRQEVFGSSDIHL